MISKPSYRAKGTNYTYAALGLLMITCLTLWALLLHQWSVPANNINPQAIRTVSIPAITNSMPEAAIAANKPAAVETALPQTSKPESASTPQADSTTPNQQVKVAAQIMNTEPLDALRKEDSSDKIVTVAKNNCISRLAQRHYNRTNPTIISLILDANPSITDVNLILINQPVKIPEITKNSLIVEKPDGFCRIYLGTFETPDAAKRYQYEAILKEKEINVIPRKVSPRETWYRVEVNKISSRDECLQVINTLQQKGLMPALGDSTTPQPGGNT
jgi:phage tail protein X